MPLSRKGVLCVFAVYFISGGILLTVGSIANIGKDYSKPERHHFYPFIALNGIFVVFAAAALLCYTCTWAGLLKSDRVVQTHTYTSTRT